MQVLKFDGLAIDGVDAMNSVAELVAGVETIGSVARPALGDAFWLAVDGLDRLAVLSRLTIEAGRAHRIRYGAQYATVLLTVLGLLVMLVRAQLGREGAYAELCEAVDAVKTRLQGAAATCWCRVCGWVWARLVVVYRGWLDAVSREVEELLGYAPLWVRAAVLR